MTKPSAFFGDDGTIASPAVIGCNDAELTLVVSAEPAVIFSSLARLCVPAFSDSCTVDIVEHERAAYRIAFPLGTRGTDATARSGCLAEHGPDLLRRLCTRFESDSDDNGPAYYGVVTHAWLRHNPTAADTAHAQLLTDRAVAAVTSERRAEGPAPATRTASGNRVRAQVP